MKTEGAATTGGTGYRVQWSDCSEGDALNSEARQFNSKFDAWNFASQLSSFGNCSNITVQIKVAENWVPVLGVLGRTSQPTAERTRLDSPDRERPRVEKDRHLNRFRRAARIRRYPNHP